MTENTIEFLKGFNIQTIISIAAIMWYFLRDVKQEVKILEAKVEAQIAAQAARSDRLYEMFVELLKEKK